MIKVKIIQKVPQFWQATYIWLWWFVFMLEPIFNTAPAALKYNARFKSGQNQFRNDHFPSLSKIREDFFVKWTMTIFIRHFYSVGKNREREWGTSLKSCYSSIIVVVHIISS